MNLNLGFRNDLGLSQQLGLAPQLLQWLRILQAPTVELSELVAAELESNPALETDESARDGDADLPADRGDDTLSASTEDTSFEESTLDEKFRALAEIDTDWREEGRGSIRHDSAAIGDSQERHQYALDSITSEESLFGFLMEQVRLIEGDACFRDAIELVVGSLDDRGYLTNPVETLAQDTGRAVIDIEQALAVVQTLDPVGVGAADLRECLDLQMRDLPDDFLPRRIVRDCLDALARHQYADIANCLGVLEEDVLESADFIRRLNPAPGHTIAHPKSEYVTPDLIIREEDGECVVELTDQHVPRLVVSSTCRALVERGDLSAEDVTYLRKKLRTASFLIDGISQRQSTLRLVGEQIARAQRDFLLASGGVMSPLTMARVASVIGVHETTVSRALANKYVRTPRGVRAMRDFFRSGYRCDDGSSYTPESVKQWIVGIIDAEDPASPTRDVDIVAKLKDERGLELARRTVAKYRGEIGVASSKERKKHHFAKRSFTRSIVPAEREALAA
jgi:RNA polymerase sigma-54 factor